MDKATIYITGYKKKNLGDDLFFLTIIKRYPHVNFLFEDIQSGYYSKLFKDFKNIHVIPYVSESFYNKILNKGFRLLNKSWKFQFYSVFRKLNKIEADIYLTIGGSIFIQPPKNLLRIKDRYLAEKKYFGNIPFIYIGCNFGPYTSSAYFKNAEYVIKNCNGICFRDSYSYNLFNKYEHVRLAPDVLFGIKEIFASAVKREKSIGISLIDFSKRKSLSFYTHSYFESLGSFIQSHNHEYETIRLFSFCEPEGDGIAIQKLKQYLTDDVKNKIEVVNYDGNLRDFILKFSEVECLLATRFHAMILGFVYGIKTIPIIYSNKMIQVLTDMRCDIPIVTLNNLNKETIDDAVTRSKVVNVDSQICDSQRQFDDLEHFLL